MAIETNALRNAREQLNNDNLALRNMQKNMAANATPTGGGQVAPTTGGSEPQKTVYGSAPGGQMTADEAMAEQTKKGNTQAAGMIGALKNQSEMRGMGNMSAKPQPTYGQTPRFSRMPGFGGPGMTLRAPYRPTPGQLEANRANAMRNYNPAQFAQQQRGAQIREEAYRANVGVGEGLGRR